MNFVDLLMLGFSEALTPTNLGFCLLGALLGTLIGVLPGIGPTATIAVLLPITFYLPPLAGLIMLAGIYYGAQYGGSTTAILVNLPGEASSVVTAVDGYKMAQKEEPDRHLPSRHSVPSSREPSPLSASRSPDQRSHPSPSLSARRNTCR